MVENLEKLHKNSTKIDNKCRKIIENKEKMLKIERKLTSYMKKKSFKTLNIR